MTYSAFVDSIKEKPLLHDQNPSLVEEGSSLLPPFILL